jgi:hypothetical protein
METDDCGEVWDTKRGAGVLRKLEHHMGWAFVGTLEMVGGVSRTWSPTE